MTLLVKFDFPRIPYPKDKKTFHALAAHGAALRALHLMESPVLDSLITTYPVDGDHEVVKLRNEDGRFRRDAVVAHRRAECAPHRALGGPGDRAAGPVVLAVGGAAPVAGAGRVRRIR